MQVIPAGYPVLLCLVFSSQAAACLLCFTAEDKRLRICQYFLGQATEQHEACLAALSAAFQPYVKTQVGAFEMEKLKDIFARIIFYLEEKGMAKVPYHQAFPEAADKVQTEVAELQTAQPCIPPCGFQEEARTYKCESCRIIECPQPINCPVQDIHKAEGDITVLRCDVKFSVPPERIIKWKFVSDIRSQELSFFEDLYIGADPSFLIRPTTGVHHGTYACEIVQGGDVLVRKFMYLNVTVQRLGKEKELQKMFQDILNAPPGAVAAEVEEQSVFSLQDLLREPDSLRKKNVILLIVGLILSSMLVTLLFMGLCYWATDVERS